MLRRSPPFLALLINIYANKMQEAVDVAVQLKYDRIQEETTSANQQYLTQLMKEMQKIKRRDQVKKEVSKVIPKIEKLVIDQLESEVLILLDTYGDKVTIKRPRDGADDDQEPSAGTDRGSKRRRSGKEPASTSAPSETTTRTAGQTTDTDVSERPADQEFETGVQDEQAEEEVQHLPDWFQKPTRLPSPDHAWNTSVPAVHETVQPWLSSLAQQDPRESFDELTDSTFDFSAFVLNRLNVQTLTPELLAGPTFELMKGTCRSLTELEYFCEEVYKATTEKLDWINPEGRQYPHDLRQPLPLVPNSQGRRVIPFHHFINNDLEYLREDLVPNSMWSQTIVKYDRSALWGISHWGKKRRQFYAFATSRESARDVYSKRRIIAVTKVEIVEWHDYKHLDWITVRRDDDMPLHKFQEATYTDFFQGSNTLRMLQSSCGKESDKPKLEERNCINVSLRMFNTRVASSRRVGKILQLGVKVNEET
ncbi:hypothetical protein Tco_0822183 [Tanacetum coccineum]|uniref:Uncharacterized protein n=1 Tax=Tanacetum coccineum TaxID=301880 RepID=A0ABQ5AJ78_9ASTR